jgi:hypothetical protein
MSNGRPTGANAIERLHTAALHTFADAFVLNEKGKDRG